MQVGIKWLIIIFFKKNYLNFILFAVTDDSEEIEAAVMSNLVENPSSSNDDDLIDIVIDIQNEVPQMPYSVDGKYLSFDVVYMFCMS